MTKKELIEALAPYDDDDLIVLSRDSEGNGYSELWSLAPMTYYDCEVYERELTEEMRKEGYTEDDLCNHPAALPAIVLWP